MDNPTDYYSDPALAKIQQEAETAGTTASNYASAATLLPEKLRQAVMEKVDYNKDIIEAKNKAQSEYFAAPAAAREKYLDPNSPNYVFNPFQAENLVTQARTNAYAPYANLTDILSARTGSLSDIINTGVSGFNSAVEAAQSAAESLRQRFADLFAVAQAKTNRDIEYAKLAKSSGSSGSSGLGLEDILGLYALLNNQGTQMMTEADIQQVADQALSEGKFVLYKPGTTDYRAYDSMNDKEYLEDVKAGYIPYKPYSSAATGISPAQQWEINLNKLTSNPLYQIYGGGTSTSGGSSTLK